MLISILVFIYYKIIFKILIYKFIFLINIINKDNFYSFFNKILRNKTLIKHIKLNTYLIFKLKFDYELDLFAYKLFPESEHHIYKSATFQCEYNSIAPITRTHSLFVRSFTH